MITSDSTDTNVTNVTQKFVICVLRKKRALTYKGFGIIKSTHDNTQFGLFMIFSDLRSMTENCVFMNDIVDATVIWLECDSWRLGHGLEN